MQLANSVDLKEKYQTIVRYFRVAVNRLHLNSSFTSLIFLASAM